MSLLFFPIIVSVFGIVFAWFLVLQNRKASAAGPKGYTASTEQASEVVRESAVSYFRKKYKTASVVGVILFILLFFGRFCFCWLPFVFVVFEFLCFCCFSCFCSLNCFLLLSFFLQKKLGTGGVT